MSTSTKFVVGILVAAYGKLAVEAGPPPLRTVRFLILSCPVLGTGVGVGVGVAVGDGVGDGPPFNHE